MPGNQERRDQREGGDGARVKAGVFEFYWEEESIVVWDCRPIALVPVKQSSLSGFSGEVWSPLRRAGLKKKPLTPLSSSLPGLISVIGSRNTGACRGPGPARALCPTVIGTCPYRAVCTAPHRGVSVSLACMHGGDAGAAPSVRPSGQQGQGPSLISRLGWPGCQ